MKKLLFILVIISTMSGVANGQEVKYKFIEADVEAFKGFAMGGLSMYVGNQNIMGLSAGAVAQYKLDGLPLITRGRVDIDVIGLAASEERKYSGRLMEWDLGVMYPLLSGKRKPKTIKMYTDLDIQYNSGFKGNSTTTTWTYYNVNEGVKKVDLLARGGFYRVGIGGVSSTGLTLGVALRSITTVTIQLEGESVETESYDEKYYYFDMIYTPINSLQPVETEPDNMNPVEEKVATNLGFRMGFFQPGRGKTGLASELVIRPFDDQTMGSLNFTYYFGWGSWRR